MMTAVCSGCSDSESKLSGIFGSSTEKNSSESTSSVVIDTTVQETDDWKFQYDGKAGGIIIKECLCANKENDDLIKSKDADIVVPSSFEGFERIKVVGIGENAFRYRVMRSLTLPDTIKTIGNRAFDAVKIYDTIIISDSVVSIGEEAFYNASVTNTIEVPKSVTSIGARAFAFSSVNSVVLPPLEAIGSSMFQSSFVEKVVMTEGTRVITNGAFNFCTNLKELIIPDSVEEINRDSFIEIGEKSPFFRAKNGEWRDKENNAISVVQIEEMNADFKAVRDDIKSRVIFRGTLNNPDTGWNIQISRTGLEDTVNYGQKFKDKAIFNALYHIEDIVKNSVLLDTVISERNKNNKSEH